MLIIAGSDDKVTAENFFQFTSLGYEILQSDGAEKGSRTIKNISYDDSVREWIAHPSSQRTE